MPQNTNIYYNVTNSNAPIEFDYVYTNFTKSELCTVTKPCDSILLEEITVTPNYYYIGAGIGIAIAAFNNLIITKNIGQAFLNAVAIGISSFIAYTFRSTKEHNFKENLNGRIEEIEGAKWLLVESLDKQSAFDYQIYSRLVDQEGNIITNNINPIRIVGKIKLSHEERNDLIDYFNKDLFVQHFYFDKEVGITVVGEDKVTCSFLYTDNKYLYMLEDHWCKQEHGL